MATIRIKKSMSARKIRELLKNIKPKHKSVKIEKYFGKIKAEENPLKLQEKLRDEWK